MVGIRRKKPQIDNLRYRNPYFGPYWASYATEGAPCVETPVGEPCGGCETAVQEGDRGFLLGHMEDEKTLRAVPWHRECLFRDAVGSPAHQEHACTCFGGEPAPSQTPEERRSEAIAVWIRHNGLD